MAPRSVPTGNGQSTNEGNSLQATAVTEVGCLVWFFTSSSPYTVPFSKGNLLMPQSKKEIEFEKASSRLINLVVVAFILIVGWYTCEFWGTPRNSKEYYAQFGDFLGGLLNPLLSFGAIYLLVHSIKYQLEELRLTRDEFARQRDELSANNKTQLKIAKAQSQSVVLPGLVSAIEEKNKYLNEILQNQVVFRNLKDSEMELVPKERRKGLIINSIDLNKAIKRPSLPHDMYTQTLEHVNLMFLRSDCKVLAFSNLSDEFEITFKLRTFDNVDELINEFLQYGGTRVIVKDFSTKLFRLTQFLSYNPSGDLNVVANDLHTRIDKVISKINEEPALD